MRKIIHTLLPFLLTLCTCFPGSAQTVAGLSDSSSDPEVVDMGLGTSFATAVEWFKTHKLLGNDLDLQIGRDAQTGKKVVRGTTTLKSINVIIEAEADSSDNIAHERTFLVWPDSVPSSEKYKIVKLLTATFFGPKIAREISIARVTPESRASRAMNGSDAYVTSRTRFYYQYCFNDAGACDLFIDYVR